MLGGVGLEGLGLKECRSEGLGFRASRCSRGFKVFGSEPLRFKQGFGPSCKMHPLISELVRLNP